MFDELRHAGICTEVVSPKCFPFARLIVHFIAQVPLRRYHESAKELVDY